MTGHPNRRPIQPPPAGSAADDDRDDACADAIEPHLSRLLARADAAGWARSEALTAILSWTLWKRESTSWTSMMADNLGSSVVTGPRLF